MHIPLFAYDEKLFMSAESCRTSSECLIFFFFLVLDSIPYVLYLFSIHLKMQFRLPGSSPHLLLVKLFINGLYCYLKDYEPRIPDGGLMLFCWMIHLWTILS